eukprot:1502296-Rhodomonas_salina.2
MSASEAPAGRLIFWLQAGRISVAYRNESFADLLLVRLEVCRVSDLHSIPETISAPLRLEQQACTSIVIQVESQV